MHIWLIPSKIGSNECSNGQYSDVISRERAQPSQAKRGRRNLKSTVTPKGLPLPKHCASSLLGAASNARKNVLSWVVHGGRD